MKSKKFGLNERGALVLEHLSEVEPRPLAGRGIPGSVVVWLREAGLIRSLGGRMMSRPDGPPQLRSVYLLSAGGARALARYRAVTPRREAC